MPKKEKVKALYTNGRVVCENSDTAREFYNQSRFGFIQDSGCVEVSLLEAYYLFEKGKLILLDGRNKEIPLEKFLKKCEKENKEFWIRYQVFKDLRNRGYICKTALKFGADFRVYDRGVKPGEDHARWVVYPVHERNALTWQDFAAKNRVAHSTKKRLMVGVVDEEGDVSYWEIRWLRP